MGKNHIRTVVLLPLIWCAALCQRPVMADEPAPSPTMEKLVNLETSFVPTKRAWTFSAEARVFGQTDNNTYGTAQVDYGVAENFGVRLRVGAGQWKTKTVPAGIVRYGGTDVEVMGVLQLGWLPHWAIAAGVSVPNSPVQTGAKLTAQLMYDHPLTQNVTLYLNPKLAILNSNRIVGIGGGASVELTRNIQVVGDYTLIVGGTNTVNLTTGGGKQQDIWGVALRFAPGLLGKNLAIDLGATNGYGSTTQFSLTPGLNNNTAIYAALHWRP
jgi:hypothetical protein